MPSTYGGRLKYLIMAKFIERKEKLAHISKIRESNSEYSIMTLLNYMDRLEATIRDYQNNLKRINEVEKWENTI